MADIVYTKEQEAESLAWVGEEFGHYPSISIVTAMAKRTAEAEAQRDEARTQLEAVTRERDEARSALGALRQAVQNALPLDMTGWGTLLESVPKMGLRLAKAEADAARLRAENVCDACLGAGKQLSPRECMCGGTGKMSDAALYLREEAVQLREALAQVRDAMLATGQGPDGDDDPRRPLATAVWSALASTPAPGPTEREMRVAEAVRDFERWPVVLEFARAMVRKLDQHAPKKGGREGWQFDDPRALGDRVAEEVRELRNALVRLEPDLAAVLDEAADVANMAMMVADAAGALDLRATAAKAVES